MDNKVKSLSSEQLKKLHKIQIEILDEVVRICKKNNLRYYLLGGTLLGAIRHKGFIPWDDDLDIAMPRDDYDKFLELAPYEIDDKYYIESKRFNKDFYLLYTKIKKNNTTFDENFIEKLNIHKGIFIDVFPLDYIKNRNGLMAKIRYILITYAKQTIFVKYKLMKITDCSRPLFCFIYSLLPTNIIFKLQNYYMTKDKYKEYNFVCNFASTYPINKEIMNKDILEQKKYYFEGKKYYSFADYDKYLTHIYGDYMVIPPKEKQVNHCPNNIDFNNGMNIITKDLIKK